MTNQVSILLLSVKLARVDHKRTSSDRDGPARSEKAVMQTHFW
jgi:hypothetical protein